MLCVFWSTLLSRVEIQPIRISDPYVLAMVSRIAVEIKIEDILTFLALIASLAKIIATIAAITMITIAKSWP